MKRTNIKTVNPTLRFFPFTTVQGQNDSCAEVYLGLGRASVIVSFHFTIVLPVSYSRPDCHVAPYAIRSGGLLAKTRRVEIGDKRYDL